MGPFEALALEAGLRLKESLAEAGNEGGPVEVRVDVITVGPPEWEDVLRRAFGMGADGGFHVLTRPGLVSAAITSDLLFRAVSHPKVPRYDLILTGVMSQDLMAGQTGPMVAEYLKFSLATSVVRISPGGRGVTGAREWEGGVRETLEIPFPALVSIQAGEYTSRYPSLSNMLRARSKPIQILTPEDSGRGGEDAGPSEIFLGTSIPEKTRAGQMVSGSIGEQVRIFKTFLKERALV